MVIEKISNHLNIPKDTLMGASIMHITGQYEIYIENYKNIIEYKEDSIRLQGRNCKIYISGKNLHIEYFNDEDMKISGRIKNVEFI